MPMSFQKSTSYMFNHDCHSNCTASSSIDWFRNQICLTLFLFKVSPSQHLFKPLLGVTWRGPSRLYKMFVRACVATKCNAHAWQKLSGKLAASRVVPRTTPCKMPITYWICALWLKGTLSRDSLNLGGIRLSDKKSRNLLELDTLGSESRKSETKAKYFYHDCHSYGAAKRTWSLRFKFNSLTYSRNRTCF